MVVQRLKALRRRLPIDLQGVQGKGNNVFLMVILNSEREPWVSTSQLLPHVQGFRDRSVPGDSPSESQATVHRDSGLSLGLKS